MKKISKFIVKNKLLLVIIFIVLSISSLITVNFVNINYDETLYLPDDSNTKVGFQAMQSEFGNYGNAIVMLEQAQVSEILTIKDQVKKIDGVRNVVWLDSFFMPIIDKYLSQSDEKSKLRAFEYAIRFLDGFEVKEELFTNDIYVYILNNFSLEEINEIRSIINTIEELDFEFSLSELTKSEEIPAETLNILKASKQQVSEFYKNNNALYQVQFEQDDYAHSTFLTMSEIEKLSSDIFMSGNAALVYYGQKAMVRETIIATIAVVAIALIILFLFSTSWFDPVIYLFSVGVAILLNMGSNIIFPNVSYITNSVASILQLALSVNYSIFLLSRYKKEKSLGKDKEEAMSEALAKSMSPISASSLTTIASFIALMFMSYRMGFDMGIVMAKGVLLSLLTVFFFLPGFILLTDKLISKGNHKSFKLQNKKVSKFTYKYRKIIPIVMLLIIIPCAYFSYNNSFLYGVEASQSSEGSFADTNKKRIESVFGPKQQLVILVHKKHHKKEGLLSYSLLEVSNKILSVNSYSLLESAQVQGLFNKDIEEQFIGKEKYNRIILNLDADEEGAETRLLLKEIDKCIVNILGNDSEYLMIGNTVAALDMKAHTKTEFNIITGIAMLLIAIVVGLSFRSLVLPFILLIVIQGGIWINMAIPYIFGSSIVFIGYMIINNILLGATIDYAILMTSNYMEARKNCSESVAMKEAHASSLRALLTSAGIFTFGGLVLGFFMSMPTTRMLGMAIFRGGLSALFMVVFVLPSLLVIFDKPINLLTYGARERLKKKEKNL